MAEEKIPTCLAEAGRRLWVAVCDSRELSDAQRELLLLACKQSDRAAEARTILTSDKVVGKDRFGQEKPHPAVQIERMASMACTNIVTLIIGKSAELETAIDPDDELFA